MMPGRGKLKKALSHPVAHNAMAMYGLLFARFLLPLITVPYLARVLGPEAWGLVFLAQAYGMWLFIVVAYNFDVTATREIAASGETGDSARVAAAVYASRAMLIVASIALTFVFRYALDPFPNEPIYLLLAWLLAVAQGLNPQWYFIGQERMRMLVAVVLSMRAVAVALTFVFVREPADAPVVLMLQAGAAAVATVVLTFVMHRDVPLRRPRWADVRQVMVDGWHMFVFKLLSSAYAAISVVLVAACVEPFATATRPQTTAKNLVGIYGAGERLFKVPRDLGMPVCQAMFPRMTRMFARDRAKADRVGRLALLAFAVVGVLVTALTIALAPLIVAIVLGPDFGETVPVLRVLVLSIPAVYVAQALTFQYMMPRHMDRALVWIHVVLIVLEVGLIAWAAPRYGPIGVAWATVAGYYFASGAMLLTVWHSGALSSPAGADPAADEPAANPSQPE